VDPSGNIFISDLGNEVVRKVTASNGNISTFAGNNTTGFSGDGGPAASAQLYLPVGLAMDSAGNLYIADSRNNRVREVTTDGNINTIAGTGNATFGGDGGQATRASLNAPYGLAVDSAGNLYIADSGNNRIRKVAPNGIITTVAGNGRAGFGGDGGIATNAALSKPLGTAVDTAGDILIADFGNNRVRAVGANGVIATVAGTGAQGYTGDGGAATSAAVSSPTGVAADNAGNVYIADFGNNVIRMLTPTGPAISSGGVVSAGDFGQFKAIAPGSWLEIYGTNLSLTRRSWTGSDFNGINAPTSLDQTSVTIAGQPAFIDFISPTQINVQAPSNLAAGPQQVIVKTQVGTSAAYTVTVNTTQPGLYGPPLLLVSGTQYVGAVFPDGAFVMPPNAVNGLNSRRAKAGDTIVIYGVGFGPGNTNLPAGQIAQGQMAYSPVPQFFFGSTQATVSYSGLAPGFVGLYQFNVVVPSVSAGDTVPLTFTLAGVKGTQTFYTAVQ
jgi:uncharacterized protein (TIGR03437 family)